MHGDGGAAGDEQKRLRIIAWLKRGIKFFNAIASGVLRPGTVGTSFIGIKNTILDPNPDGKGELATSARNVFMGYVWDEVKTRAAFTEDQDWYKSGDIAKYVFYKGTKFLAY